MYSQIKKEKRKKKKKEEEIKGVTVTPVDEGFLEIYRNI
jgi:hypothetical protein